MKTFGIILLVFGALATFVTLFESFGAIHEVTAVLLLGLGCIIICLADIRAAILPPLASTAPALGPAPTATPSSAAEAEWLAGKAAFEAEKAQRARPTWFPKAAVRDAR